ncbi:MAG TPA: hypothetical protein VMV10_14055 [Pirellulales bacterium]|nr:hypothetical protein [Pirellulales bacterium]
MNTWYKLNPNRFSCRELWRMSGRGPWPFAQAVWRKWFNVQTPPTSGFAFPDSPQFVELDSLPDRPREVLRAAIAAVERHGFRFVFCHKVLYLGDIADCTAVLISADGMSLANVGWLKIGAGEGTSLGLGSRTQTRRLLTHSEPRRADPPPDFDIWHLPGKSIDDLILAHSQRLDRLGRENILPATEADIAARIIENQGLYRAFNLARGVYEPMTQAEVDRLSDVVMADVVAETGNPFQAPREDVGAAPSSIIPTTLPGTWQGSVIGGFVVGAIFMEVVGLASYDPQDMEDMGELGGAWLYLFLMFVAWPFVIGAFCAAVGLAVWLIRRIFWRLIP